MNGDARVPRAAGLLTESKEILNAVNHLAGYGLNDLCIVVAFLGGHKSSFTPQSSQAAPNRIVLLDLQTMCLNQRISMPISCPSIPHSSSTP
jgi:hypothetical protein